MINFGINFPVFGINKLNLRKNNEIPAFGADISNERDQFLTQADLVLNKVTENDRPLDQEDIIDLKRILNPNVVYIQKKSKLFDNFSNKKAELLLNKLVDSCNSSDNNLRSSAVHVYSSFIRLYLNDLYVSRVQENVNYNIDMEKSIDFSRKVKNVHVFNKESDYSVPMIEKILKQPFDEPAELKHYLPFETLVTLKLLRKKVLKQQDSYTQELIINLTKKIDTMTADEKASYDNKIKLINCTSIEQYKLVKHLSNIIRQSLPQIVDKFEKHIKAGKEASDTRSFICSGLLEFLAIANLKIDNKTQDKIVKNVGRIFKLEKDNPKYQKEIYDKLMSVLKYSTYNVSETSQKVIKNMKIDIKKQDLGLNLINPD